MGALGWLHPMALCRSLATELSALHCHLGSTWDSSELTDHKALLSTGLIIPLAIGEDLHTVLIAAIVVGLPRSPVGIDQRLPSWIGERSLCLGVSHA